MLLSAEASITNFYDIDSEIIVMNLPALNNGGDDVMLMENNSFVIDSLNFSSVLGRRQ
ncbi:MAG: hypothetical protein U5K00_01630 [Melioribacteraceae bacterium]|nr:hypothetical protein [Melioribacteraceae bacterium]